MQGQSNQQNQSAIIRSSQNMQSQSMKYKEFMNNGPMAMNESINNQDDAISSQLNNSIQQPNIMDHQIYQNRKLVFSEEEVDQTKHNQPLQGSNFHQQLEYIQRRGFDDAARIQSQDQRKNLSGNQNFNGQFIDAPSFQVTNTHESTQEKDLGVRGMLKQHLGQAKSILLNNPFTVKPSNAEANATKKLEQLKRRVSPAQQQLQFIEKHYNRVQTCQSTMGKHHQNNGIVRQLSPTNTGVRFQGTTLSNQLLQTVNTNHRGIITTETRYSGETNLQAGIDNHYDHQRLQTNITNGVGNLNLIPQQSTALSTVRGVRQNQNVHQKTSTQVFPIKQRFQERLKTPSNTQNPMLSNIQRIIQNNITENDIERNLMNKKTVHDSNADTYKIKGDVVRNNESGQNLDSVRSIQANQQQTERLQMHYDKKFNQREEQIPSIEKTIEILEKQSPFKHMHDEKMPKKHLVTNDSPNQEDSKFEDDMSSKSLSPLKNRLNSLEIDEYSILQDIQINDQAHQIISNQPKFKLDLGKLKSQNSKVSKEEIVPLNICSISDKQEIDTQPPKQQVANNHEDNNNTCQSRRSGDKINEKDASKLKMQKQVTETNVSTAKLQLNIGGEQKQSESGVNLISERHKFFNLVKSEQNEQQVPTLSQQVKLEYNQSQNQSEVSSSFDSINPDELVQKIGNTHVIISNYASHLSQASKLSRYKSVINGGQNLYTGSSNYSSIYLNTQHTRQQSKDSMFQQADTETNELEKVEINQQDKVESCLNKIDQNLSTFTTDQFLQLRSVVQAVGFETAAKNGSSMFGLQKGIDLEKALQTLQQERLGELNSISKDSALNAVKIESQDIQYSVRELKMKVTNSETKEHDESIVTLKRNQLSDGRQSLISDKTRFGNSCTKQIQSQNEFVALPRKIQIQNHEILCSGFLATPNIKFCPELYNSPDKSETESKNGHNATISQLSSQFIFKDLISADILNLLHKQKCQMVSCGFESCISLSENGQVYSWGYGGSGVLGHSDYKTQLNPKKIDALNNVIYIQAGGYHNGAIDTEGQVYTWGRGDVGQLALSINEQELQRDKMGLVALKPHKINTKLKIKQLALGDAHSLFLSKCGQVHSCGWNELGQLGVSQKQIEISEKDGKLYHHVDLLTSKVKQIQCGAVFSLALTETGDLYAWGSNNNGQIGKIQIESEEGSTPLRGSIQSEQDSIKAKFAILPQIIQFSDTNVKIDEMIAGDCHALALSNEKIYAWGQGILISPTVEDQGEEVICNMPVMLGGGYQNQMVISLNGEIRQHSDAIEDTVFQNHIIDHSPLQKIHNRTEEKKEVNNIQQKFSALGTQRLENIGNLENSHEKQPLNCTQSIQRSNMKISKTSNYDLETVQNTDDYNNYLRKRDEDVNIENSKMLILDGKGLSENDLDKSPSRFGQGNSDLEVIQEYSIPYDHDFVLSQSLGTASKGKKIETSSNKLINKQNSTQRLTENQKLESQISSSVPIEEQHLLGFQQPFQFLSITQESKENSPISEKKPAIVQSNQSNRQQSDISQGKNTVNSDTQLSAKASRLNMSQIKQSQSKEQQSNSLVSQIVQIEQPQSNKISEVAQEFKGHTGKIIRRKSACQIYLNKNSTTSKKRNACADDIPNEDYTSQIERYASSPKSSLDIKNIEQSSQISQRQSQSNNFTSEQPSQLSISHQSYNQNVHSQGGVRGSTGSQKQNNSLHQSSASINNGNGGTGEACRAPKVPAYTRSQRNSKHDNLSQQSQTPNLEYSLKSNQQQQFSSTLSLKSKMISIKQKLPSQNRNLQKSPKCISSKNSQNNFQNQFKSNDTKNNRKKLILKQNCSPKMQTMNPLNSATSLMSNSSSMRNLGFLIVANQEQANHQQSLQSDKFSKSSKISSNKSPGSSLEKKLKKFNEDQQSRLSNRSPKAKLTIKNISSQIQLNK